MRVGCRNVNDMVYFNLAGTVEGHNLQGNGGSGNNWPAISMVSKERTGFSAT